MLETEIERQLQRDSHMPATYYEIMVSLSEAPDRTLRMSELAERNPILPQPALACGRADGDRGLDRATRLPVGQAWAPSPVLTEAGFAVLADAAPGHVEQVSPYCSTT